MMQENKAVQELDGIVEMDEKYIGGKPRKLNTPYLDTDNAVIEVRQKKKDELDKEIKKLNKKGFDFEPQGKNRSKIVLESKRGRGTDNIPVVGIVERNGNVVAEVMKNLTYAKLKEMVQKYVVEKDSVLITDSYSRYNSMKKIIEHIKTDHNKFYSYKGVNSNTIESFWAIIERGIMGQYHSVSPKMLPNYVAEFVYHYNNRKDTDRMFDELLKNLLNASKPTS